MSKPENNTDARLLEILQKEFPLISRPFEWIGERLSVSSEDVLSRVARLKADGIIRQISAIFDSAALGYSSALVALEVDEGMLDSVGEAVARHPGVSHCYSRAARFNLWFTITVGPDGDLDGEVAALARLEGINSSMVLSAQKIFKIGVFLKMSEEGEQTSLRQVSPSSPLSTFHPPISEDDRAVVRVLQKDLPLVAAPFAELASQVPTTEQRLLADAHRFLETGAMRRFAAVLAHQRAGYRANAMVCWNVGPDDIDEVGSTFASFESVSHCYERPSYLDWPYSLYTMIHARTLPELDVIIDELVEQSGVSDYLVLRTVREYKKSRVQYFVDQ